MPSRSGEVTRTATEPREQSQKFTIIQLNDRLFAFRSGERHGCEEACLAV